MKRISQVVEFHKVTLYFKKESTEGEEKAKNAVSRFIAGKTAPSQRKNNYACGICRIKKPPQLLQLLMNFVFVPLHY